MTTLPHLPALRRGRPYESLDKLPVNDYRTGAPLATISQVNAGIIRKDLQRVHESRRSLKNLTIKQLLDICAAAADLFQHAPLPLGTQGEVQSPQHYVETLSRTSGLPHVMVERNMQKIGRALTEMPAVLNGLTRGLDLGILEAGFGEQSGTRICFYPVSQALGLVMPSNSPGVNSLWLPAIPLRIPVMLKPGREEPWTPFRLIQAFVAAGCPSEAFGFYPTDHEGAAEILRSSGRALIFGDKASTSQYSSQPGIQIHGPGFSKVLLGEDQVERWPDYLEVMVSSIAGNGGRSCVNASAILTPRYGAEIAEALAQRVGPIEPLSAQDPQATLAAFANPKMAMWIDQAIEAGLATPGARDVTADYRKGPRMLHYDGGTYLCPTVVLCEAMNHPLANREFLFPYASVVEIPQAEMLNQMGPSLAVTAITRDPAWIEQLVESPCIQRLNLGPIPTSNVSWDQPHEGNMFEFLYQRRALERPAKDWAS